MVIRSLEKIVREELNRHSSQRRVNLNKMEEEGEEEDVAVVVADTNHLFDNDTILSPSLLKLRIRNRTEHLNWRIAILWRDNFRCQICTASIKDNERVNGSNNDSVDSRQSTYYKKEMRHFWDGGLMTNTPLMELILLQRLLVQNKGVKR